MSDSVITYLFILAWVLFGGAEVYLAVQNFKSKKYFWFGVSIMWTVAAALWIGKLIFTN